MNNIDRSGNEDEQSEAVELADSDVYFEQNYDAADASVDWVSPNMQSAITLVDDGNGGKMVDNTYCQCQQPWTIFAFR